MKTLAKQLLARTGIRAVAAENIAARYLDHPPRSMFDVILLRCFADLQGLRFIQIGANDGQRYDPLAAFIARHGWQGVMLEPMPAYFAALQNRYGAQPGLTLLPAALDATQGTRAIYHLADCTGLPDWTHGLASLDRGRLEAAARELGLPDSAIASRQIATVTWDEVRLRLGPGGCDLLVLDTEGFDLPLLRSAGLGDFSPRVVHFEHACAPESEQAAMHRELRRLGYEIATEGPDTTAWRPDPAAT
ncbi:MAG: hypothetical protein B9S34_01820 [Opitutia bacterium Tous-C1TDCM]|nr:MAG: hypothetical protein B9S34_01820 [Opitutae bacterium Tous-C1TDCM]